MFRLSKMQVKVIPIFYPVFSIMGALPNELFHGHRPFSPDEPRIVSSVTKYAMERLLTAEELTSLINLHGSPHLGFVPDDFISGNSTPLEVFKAFDNLVPELTEEKDDFYLGKKRIFNGKKQFVLKFAQTQIEGNCYDGGQDGRVFKLTVNGKNYALKIFKAVEDWAKSATSNTGPKSERNIGPKSEIANGLYFTAQPTKDMSYFYFGNPIAGYCVSEWIDENTNVSSRTGKTLWEQGYEEDAHLFVKGDKRVNGFVVDYGRIRKMDNIGRFAISRFQTPNYPGLIFGYNELKLLPEPWRLHAFKYLLANYSDCALFIQDELQNIPPEDRLEGLKELLQVIKPKCIAGRLSNPDLWGKNYEIADQLINEALAKLDQKQS